MLLIRLVLEAFDTFTARSVVTSGTAEHHHRATVRTHRPIAGSTHRQGLFGESQPGVVRRGRKHLDSVRASTGGGTAPAEEGAPPAAWFVSVLSRNVALGEHDAKDRAVGRPPAPEDRTWRHPAEVGWEARQAPLPVVAVPRVFRLASSARSGRDTSTQRIAANTVAAETIADDTTTHVGIGVTTRDPEGGELGSAVTAMVQDGPADVGGLYPGDVIVGIGDQPITSTAEMVAVLRTYDVGHSANVMVDRGQRHLTCPVVVGSTIYNGT